MNLVNFLLLLLPAVICTNAQGDITDPIIAIQDYCHEKENVTIDVDYSSEDIQPETYEWKCMLECIAEELGVVCKIKRTYYR